MPVVSALLGRAGLVRPSPAGVRLRLLMPKRVSVSSTMHILRPARWILPALVGWACHGSGPANVASTASGKRYTVRAEVVTIPVQPGGELVLRHEAIPDFTDKSGAVVGMDSMVMPFPIPANLSLVGLTPGDKIEFVFSVDWAQSRYLVESIKKLPAETTLKMGKAQAIGSMGSHMLEDAKK